MSETKLMFVAPSEVRDDFKMICLRKSEHMKDVLLGMVNAYIKDNENLLFKKGENGGQPNTNISK
jgi:hypothetical protein